MEFVIEKNIPVPAGRASRNGYPFERMEVGDSFAVTGLASSQDNALRSTVCLYNKRHAPVSLRVRKMGPGELRVWRVK